MVKKIENLYKCEICLLKYKDKKMAEKCEDWCKNNGTCNLEITKHAVKKEALI